MLLTGWLAAAILQTVHPLTLLVWKWKCTANENFCQQQLKPKPKIAVAVEALRAFGIWLLLLTILYTTWKIEKYPSRLPFYRRSVCTLHLQFALFGCCCCLKSISQICNGWVVVVLVCFWLALFCFSAFSIVDFSGWWFGWLLLNNAWEREESVIIRRALVPVFVSSSEQQSPRPCPCPRGFCRQ